MGASIQDIIKKFKALVGNDALFTTALVLLVGIGSFGLGRSSLTESVSPEAVVANVAVTGETTAKPSSRPTPAATAQPTTQKAAPEPITEAVVPEAEAGEAMYVGSKNGTKFHLLTCPGASQIKEENKVYFTSKQEAYSKGYTEAANCKGI